jgi:hypothetical protein
VDGEEIGEESRVRVKCQEIKTKRLRTKGELCFFCFTKYAGGFVTQSDCLVRWEHVREYKKE